MAETMRSIMKKQALVKMSSETQSQILCRDTKQRKAFREIAKELGLTIPDPICLHELITKFQKDKEYGREIKDVNLVFNDTDYILKTGLEKYGFEELKMNPICDNDKQFEECVQRTYTVHEFMSKIGYQYTGIKIMDLSTNTELLSIEGYPIFKEKIPDDIGDKTITNIMFDKKGFIIINLGEEPEESE